MLTKKLLKSKQMKKEKSIIQFLITLILLLIIYLGCSKQNIRNNLIIEYNSKIKNLKNLKECNNWRYPDSTELFDIIFSLKPQSDNAIHYQFDNFDCYISGKLIKDKINYTYYFNAGGYVELINDKNERYYLGCEQNSEFEKYFINIKYTEEEMDKIMKEDL